MTLDSMKFFCAIVECGSFRLAAERVHRSQPALSQQLKSIEAELGHVLLDRRTCAPTPIGKLLYERSLGIIRGAEELKRELLDFDESSGELRIGTSDTIAVHFLPPFIRAYSDTSASSRVMITSRPTRDIVAQVLQGELELGIVTLPCGESGLEEHSLFEQRFVLVAPRGHGLARRDTVELSELHDEPLLLLDAATRTGSVLREYFQRESFEPEVVLDSGSFEVIKRYVAEGIGLSFLPEYVVSGNDPKISTINVQSTPTVTIGAVWRRGAYRTKAELAFLRLLKG